MPTDKEQRRLAVKREQARLNPLRARLLELYEQDHRRSMRAAGLTQALAAEGWQVNLSQVNYHLRQLQDAQLVPLTSLGT